ncbi:helix-turn-helix transcriptional regulator [Zavarzinia sp.]|uniref:AraC family transcriptional regulator n=1 Tax=Zavarzinia sp. TaxID=2027920 RepID=UPI003569B597
MRGFFPGHAFDLHSHDEVLIGVTEQGVQKFRCRGAPRTSNTPGRAILIEPGEAHDGDSPELAEGPAPAGVAAEVGFADQSDLGRWFRRAYGATPATYRRLCTGVPD